MTFENPQELPDDSGILLQGPINCIRNQTIIVFLSELDLYHYGRQVVKEFDELLNSSQSFDYENSL